MMEEIVSLVPQTGLAGDKKRGDIFFTLYIQERLCNPKHSFDN